MISADIHTHTDYFHGRSTIEEMYAKAQEIGLKYYGFSEHTPLPEGFSCLLYKEGDMNEAFHHYAQDVLALKEKIKQNHTESHPKILLGMELDFTPHAPAWMDMLLAAYPYDYVIGSVHFVDDRNIGLWDSANASAFEQNEYFTEYYRCIADLARWGKADIISHPDFVKLKCVDAFTAWLETEHAKNIVNTTLNAIAKAGMILEVSTGGLKKTCQEIHPAPRIMEWVSEKKISISFGSDSHYHDNVAFAFEELAAFAKSYGYKQHVIFENRLPQYLDF